ncbi:hypothetical protein PTKIN_Ptkin02bG0095700 [Pterospermum kingtungense]
MFRLPTKMKYWWKQCLNSRRKVLIIIMRKVVLLKHQKVLEEKLPDHGLKEKHISSRCKTLRKIRAALFDLINKGSGFGWDEEKKMVVAPPSVWNEYVKSHFDAASLKGKPFKFYDELGIIYGTERATGKDVE